MAYANDSVYWVGADGNVWLKGSDGAVSNMGSFDSAGANDTTWRSYRNGDTLQGTATRIADPNVQAVQAASTTTPTATGGGTTVVDKSGDIALNNAALGSTDANTATGISKVDQALAGLTGQYDTEKTTNQGVYQTNSDQNQNNLQKNKESALVNAAQGRQGLFGTLASLGALNGSGVKLANNAVQTGANQDLSGAADTYGGNQSSLDTAIGTFNSADAKRREDARIAADNAKTKVQNEGLTSKQKIYTTLANDYQAEGDTGNASKYTGMASELYPQIAATNVPDTTNLGYSAAPFTAPSLSSYLAGGASTAVSATPTSGRPGIPGLIANTSQLKKKVTA